MDQEELRKLEKKCIQEEPARCVAACPIHVDARGFVAHVKDGAWAEAWKVLRKTMPFPGILGRICDAPCRLRCKRNEAGDPIEIGALERACVATPAPGFPVPPMPARDKRVAVFGSGMSSLTVCWDLARKGYRVTIFEPGTSLGGPLSAIEPAVLPPGVIEAETDVLAKMGVTLQFNANALSEDVLRRCSQDFDAVYIGMDAVSAGNTGLPTDAGGLPAIVPKLQTTGMDGVFAGGCSGDSAASPVWQAAEGRWAATSMDRFIQNVSMTAGREKDGPYTTRLYTRTDEVGPESAVVVSNPESGYTETEAIQEAGRCLLCECRECVKVCAYLEHYQAYPKKYVREIYNNESIVMGARHANKMINSCSLCGLCERVCPEDFAMGDICLHARKSMVDRDKMPPSAHEFAIMDMEFSQSDDFAMARHQPGMTSSRYLFFPGCQLCASSPNHVFSTYNYLCAHLAGGVGLMLGCCAAPAYWAGRDARFKTDLEAWKGRWSDLGEPEVIPACSTCLTVFSEHLPEVPVISLWQVLETMDPEFPETAKNRSLAVHDPCTTRSLPKIQDAVRHLLTQSGAATEELPLGREFTECCGFGGLMQNANPRVAEETIKRRAGLSPSDYVTYCGMCRDNLASTGKRVVHILDILFPDPGDTDPAGRPNPGWSLRRENRTTLKQKFEQELWGVVPPETTERERIDIRVSPQVRQLLEERRILDEDIQNVLFHAKQGGNTFFNETAGHYKASFRPRHVTFWVDYSCDENGFVIHNAYSHRMEVKP